MHFLVIREKNGHPIFEISKDTEELTLKKGKGNTLAHIFIILSA